MSEAKYLCLTCKHASATVPSEVIIEVIDREGTVVKSNIHNALVVLQNEMSKRYKHVHYCPQLKAIVVGGDSPAQMRKSCELWESREE